jgi:hypothetical protein
MVIAVGASMLAVAGCQVDAPKGGVPAGVTVTIPEGL